MTYLPSWATLKAYYPNGTLFKDYSGFDDLKLEFTDQCNGGFFDCTFTLCDYYFNTPGFGYTIVIKDEVENFVLFRGLAQQPEFDWGNSAAITAIGHGNPSGSSSAKRDWGDGNQTPPDGRQIYPAGTPIINVITDSLTMTQQVFSGTLADMGGVQLSQEFKDLQGSSPFDTWNEISTQTASLGSPLQWFIRESGGLSVLNTRFLDTAVRYRCNWDNDTVKVKDAYDQTSVINGATVRYGNGKRGLAPVPPSIRDHTVLPTNNDRDKYVDMNNEIRGDDDANALAGVYLSRFNSLRPLNGTITLCGASVTAEPPIVSSVTYPSGRTNYPVHMIQSGWVIKTIGCPAGQAPFNVEEHFIVSVHYAFDTDTMTLTTGEIVNLGSSIRLVSSFFSSKASMAAFQAQYNAITYIAEANPIYGPQSDGTLPAENDSQIGTPTYVLNDNFTNSDSQLYLPFKAGIQPETIPDYGTQANFGREADSVGIKGFIRVIPQKVINWEIAFLPTPASDTIPTDSITIEFYDDYPFTPGAPFATKSVSAAKNATGTFTGLELKTFANGGKIGIRVSVAAATASCGFMVAVGGKKLYPDLGITS